ncbi:M48 family metallopeptidase [Anaerosinus massiliensis]|uniref:M48 family metallopeptidase n=1 Tax=Massilibacillus massiliensis TaxID=1806837 RepID=UPI000A73C851|nr:M48 family metallopeptidase [Massilibacillus massiliensis]
MLKIKQITSIFITLCLVQLWILPIANAGIISTKQEISIGEGVAKQIEQTYKLLDDPELQERVDRIGKRIVSVSDRKDLPYSFKVLDVDEVNAMAAPGGYVYVFKGLIELMPTDDELAGIIGHEVGHVVKRHSMGQLEKSLGMTLLMGAAFGTKGMELQAVALNAITAGYSRKDEREADKLGYELSVKAGYNQYGMLMGLTKLYELNPKQKNDLFSDHPEAAQRIKLAKKYLSEQGVRPTAVETATENGKTAKVVDGDWSLPEFRVAIGNTGPLYRAYLVAGRLYNITKKTEYSTSKYILDGDGTNVTIYYDDQIIITITPEDAAACGVTLEDLTREYLDALKKWQVKNKAA